MINVETLTDNPQIHDHADYFFSIVDDAQVESLEQFYLDWIAEDSIPNLSDYITIDYV